MKFKILLVVYFLGIISSFAIDDRPNIVFLFTDDQRANTIHALGNNEIITPTIDKLVEGGVSFTNAYCQGSFTGAVCLASRLMIITGQNWEKLDYKNRTAVGSFAGKKVAKAYHHPKTPLLPELFNDAGYYTGAIIKRGPSPKGLEGYFTFTHELDAKEERLGGFSGKLPIDVSMEFLKEYDQSDAKKKDNPFFLYIGFAGPHDERFIDKKYLDLYPQKPSLPDNFQATYDYSNGFMLFGRDNCLLPHPRTKEMIRTELLYYYGIITSIDENINRLIQELKRRGEYENTIFVYSSDHGLSIGSHGMLGKQNIYEEAMKAPLIISGPGIPKNIRSNAKLYLHDLYATFCDFAGIDIPQGIHSKSIAPVLKGDVDTHRENVYLPYLKIRSLRSGDYKLIKFLDIERPQLFNLVSDPGEMNDLAGDKKYKDIVAQLELELKNEMMNHNSPESWPANYTSKTLKTISSDEVVKLRHKNDTRKGPVKQAKNTEDARNKAGHRY